MIKLTPRQEKIIKLLPAVTSVADIGCDHGRLAVFLLQNKLASYVVATDISAPSLNKAKILAEQEGVTANISLRVGDGLTVLQPDEVQAVVISGMGANTIMEILQSKRLNDRVYFILQPNKQVPLLREYLISNGYIILDEAIAQEGHRFYETILAQRGQAEPLRNYFIPQKPLQRKDKELLPFLLREKQSLEQALVQAQKAKDEQQKEKVLEMQQKLKEINEVIKCLQ